MKRIRNKYIRLRCLESGQGSCQAGRAAQTAVKIHGCCEGGHVTEVDATERVKQKQMIH